MKFYERSIKFIVYCVAVYLLIVLLNSTKVEIYKNSIKHILRKRNIKFILLWTSISAPPFNEIGEGQNIFTKNNCPKTNCYVTSNRTYFDNDVTKFDAIAFYGPAIPKQGMDFPTARSPHQKYIFASMESAVYYAMCIFHFGGFFNWTWTYKLNSDVRFAYIVVRDLNGTVVGPKARMNWLELNQMKPVDEDLKNILRKKVKAVAWFVSNCVTSSKRELFVSELSKALLEKYGYTIDIFGKCGTLNCTQTKDCDKQLENYYFYLSFENSISNDYVTEKLLRPLRNLAVPIVYGGANYSRYMPESAYLNARELGVHGLAQKIDELIKDQEKYAQYFRWRNHYSYHDIAERNDTNPYCKMCELLNNEERVKKQEVIYNFKYWWHNLELCDSDRDFY